MKKRRSPVCAPRSPHLGAEPCYPHCVRRRLIALFFALSPACVLDELDLTGKQCPCSKPYVCDDSKNTCVRGEIGAGDGGGEDGADGAQDPDGGEPGDAEPADDGVIMPIECVPPCAGNTICDRTTGVCRTPPPCTLDVDCGDASFVCENMMCLRRCDLI